MFKNHNHKSTRLFITQAEYPKLSKKLFVRNSQTRKQIVFEEMGEFNGNGEKKWDKPNSSDNDIDDEDEEEALSLCDLPVLENNGEDQKNTENCQSIEAEDFDFFGTDLTKESEMCVADEVFFKGQILPLRLSVSSESGFKQNSLNSRSESMDRSSSNGFTTTSLSSRSNSTSSHNSTTTSTTTNTTSTTTSTYKPKIRNQFHSHPSPKPQIISCSRPANASNRSRKSNIWGIFKVGLIRTPEIELQELKLRNNKERGFNSRSSSSNSSRKSDIEVKTEKKMKKKKKTDRFGFENCRCSVDAVETVVSIKKTNHNNNKNKKIVINDRKPREEEEDDVKEKEEMEKKEKQSKQALYHTRTFEWLKELSIADVPVEL